MNTNPRASRAVSPGRIIRRELDERGWEQKDLAAIMGRPPQAISEIIRGRKRITPETAIQLAEAFGTSPELWLNLESTYRLHLARRRRQDDDEVARRSRLYSLAPVSELLKRGWIEAGESITALEQAVCEFLEIPNVHTRPHLAVSMRRTPTREPERIAQIAWAKHVQHLARAQRVAPFDRERLRAAIPRLLAYAERIEDVRHVPAFLREMGVHFLVVPHLPHTYLDGAAMDGEEPIVALTLRYDRVDSFWFTLLHEIAHIVAGHTGIYLDNLDARDEEPEEEAANRMAQEWLIPADQYAKFLEAQQPPYISRKALEAFAASIGRHPGIVLGRLHYEGVVPYRNMRGLLVKVSPYLTS